MAVGRIGRSTDVLVSYSTVVASQSGLFLLIQCLKQMLVFAYNTCCVVSSKWKLADWISRST